MPTTSACMRQPASSCGSIFWRMAISVTRGLEIASCASLRITTKSESWVNQHAVPNAGPSTADT